MSANAVPAFEVVEEFLRRATLPSLACCNPCRILCLLTGAAPNELFVLAVRRRHSVMSTNAVPAFEVVEEFLRRAHSSLSGVLQSLSYIMLAYARGSE